MKKLFYLVLALLSLSACTGAPLSLEGTKWATHGGYYYGENGEECYDPDNIIALNFVSSDEVWFTEMVNEAGLNAFFEGDERTVEEVFTYEYKAPKVSIYYKGEYEGYAVIKGDKLTLKEVCDHDQVLTKKK